LRQQRQKGWIRSILLARSSQREAPAAQPETQALCQSSDQVMCSLTIAVNTSSSLLESVSSIIRSLAQTGLGLLTFMALVLALAVAGALALAEGWRRAGRAKASGAPETSMDRSVAARDAWAYP
jgi:hypothetical protein